MVKRALRASFTIFGTGRTSCASFAFVVVKQRLKARQALPVNKQYFSYLCTKKLNAIVADF
jgi:hypothetical protein